MKTYSCRKCQHEFDMEEEIPYCPACDCKDLNEVDGYVG
jgi:Zn finger protein HypA/HybF involved in hydrogenase expression